MSIDCIVPGGGLSPHGDRWISAKPGFFLPVNVLSRVFRGKLLSKFEAASWPLDGVVPILARASMKNWVVYSKPPVAGADPVLDYLGRYTHRIAISNERLVSFRDGRVTFRWKDRARGGQEKLLTLDAENFLRRFLQHVLPRGLVRIRHYGFLANAARRRLVARCRGLLGAETPPPAPAETWPVALLRLTGRDVTRCPKCHEGRLQLVEALAPASRRFVSRGAVS